MQMLIDELLPIKFHDPSLVLVIVIVLERWTPVTTDYEHRFAEQGRKARGDLIHDALAPSALRN
jgi:hypothetical protein